MDHLLILAVVAVVVVIAVTALAPRAGVAAPLVLLVLGAGVSLLPQVPALDVPPELILAGVLPPLLYSAAVSLPTMDFRRDFTAISGLSVVLVVLTSVVLGWLFTLLVPGLDLALGIALGAIVSPTDAVATTIVKRLGASPRVVTVLEGESLLNDASALVLLRSAVVAIAGTVSLVEVATDFVYAVLVAVGVGVAVGWVGLRVRARLRHATLSTAVSFVVPFVAYVPAEELGASGLVAVVAAGLVTGSGAARHLRPQDRIAERSNWGTVELLLEGGVFLLMGLELFALIEDVGQGERTLARAAGVAAVAAVVVLVVRTLYVTSLVLLMARRARKGRELKDAFAGMQDTLERRLAAAPGPRAERVRSNIVRRTADIDYLLAKPLGPREGTLLVWAGMRGVVTLAAAQTLPADTPDRSFLVLVAFGVAVGTLLVQGGSLPWVVRRLGLTGTRDDGDPGPLRAEANAAVRDLLEHAHELRRPDGRPYDEAVLGRLRAAMVRESTEDEEALELPDDAFAQYTELRLAAISAQREVLLRARASGVYGSAELNRALAQLDADQIAVELRRESD